MSKEKVLIIRKPDSTVHQVPLENEARLKSLNNMFPTELQWSFEKMDKEEAAKLDFIDPNFVTGVEAVERNADLQKQIDDLKAQLAAANGEEGKAEKAVDLIARINAAETAKEVKEILGSDERATVIAAAEKKTASFQA